MANTESSWAHGSVEVYQYGYAYDDNVDGWEGKCRFCGEVTRRRWTATTVAPRFTRGFLNYVLWSRAVSCAGGSLRCTSAALLYRVLAASTYSSLPTYHLPLALKLCGKNDREASARLLEPFIYNDHYSAPSASLQLKHFRLSSLASRHELLLNSSGK